jgi:hypothetical protein
MNTQQIIYIAVGLLALLVVNVAPWLYQRAVAGFSAVTKPAVAKSGTALTRREVLDALDGAFAYFAAVECKEGMAAIKLAVGHAFEHKEPSA